MGLADGFRRQYVPPRAPAEPWLRPPDNRAEGRVYRPDEIMRMQQLWRDQPFVQSEQGQYYQPAPPAWRPWWSVMPQAQALQTSGPADFMSPGLIEYLRRFQ